MSTYYSIGDLMIAQVENVNIKKSQEIEKILSTSNWEPYSKDTYYNTEININRDLPIECR
jgi:tRNA G26 N,N-dimethylase Trm1